MTAAARLGAIARKARVLLSVNYALMLAYRGEIFLWAIATSLPLIMMGVWMEAGATGSFALSQVEMARYFIAVFVVRQLTIVWAIYDFEFQVTSGRLSPLLLQPMDPVWRNVMAHIGEQAARLPFCILLVALCLYLYPQAALGDADHAPWTPGVRDLGLGLLACYATFALRYLMQYTVAMLSFWFERASAFEQINMLPHLFLSGLIAPLEVYTGSPTIDAVREFAMWTPYPYMFWFPAKLLTGGEVPLLQGFTVIAAWTVVLFALNRCLWRKGLKHYSAMGA